MERRTIQQGLAEEFYVTGLYEIRIKGHLDRRWAEWFEVLTITHQANGDTLLTGPLADQPALHGLLKVVRDLGLPLVSVIQVDPDVAKGPMLARTVVTIHSNP
jgi:hypothetical protein